MSATNKTSAAAAAAPAKGPKVKGVCRTPAEHLASLPKPVKVKAVKKTPE
jgi:hypothetical protein